MAKKPGTVSDRYVGWATEAVDAWDGQDTGELIRLLCEYMGLSMSEVKGIVEKLMREDSDSFYRPRGQGSMSETLREAEAKAWALLRIGDATIAGPIRRAHHDGFKAGMEYACRTPGPATARAVNLIRDCLDVAGVAEVIIDETTAREILAEHEPAGPARSIQE